MEKQLEGSTTRNLGQAVGFTGEDLAANRAGMMTPSQQEKFRSISEQMQKSTARGLPILIILLVLMFVGGGGYMLWQLMQSGGLGTILAVAPILIVVMLVIGAILVFQIIRTVT